MRVTYGIGTNKRASGLSLFTYPGINAGAWGSATTEARKSGLLRAKSKEPALRASAATAGMPRHSCRGYGANANRAARDLRGGGGPGGDAPRRRTLPRSSPIALRLTAEGTH